MDFSQVINILFSREKFSFPLRAIYSYFSVAAEKGFPFNIARPQGVLRQISTALTNTLHICPKSKILKVFYTILFQNRNFNHNFVREVLYYPFVGVHVPIWGMIFLI